VEEIAVMESERIERSVMIKMRLAWMDVLLIAR
jgi:hypothetical protein